MNLTKEEMLSEIQYYYPNFYSNDGNLISKQFKEIVEDNSKILPIKKLFDDYSESSILIDTPDGYQFINDFWIKRPRVIFTIKTKNHNINCSSDHLIETSTGWIKAAALSIDNTILTKDGMEDIIDISAQKEKKVYDFEIDHKNHRYWAGSGISSHNTGKTFLCLNIVKNAEDKGYSTIWFDTESAIDIDTMKRFGINTDLVNYQPIDSVNTATTILSNIVSSLRKQRAEGLDTPKLLIILDSLGNLSTRKEMEDANSGSEKKDMTRAQEIKRLFRVIINRCGLLKMPVVITNHTYKNVGSFISSDVVGGGSGSEYNPSINLMLSKAQLKENDTKTGIIVSSRVYKSRFTKEINIKFHISFYKGMNPYVGLQRYVDWETCGIGPGKIENGVYIEEKTVDMDKVKYWAVKHLNKHIKPRELFTSEVFPHDVLVKLDEKIKKLFEFPDIMQAQMEEIEELVKVDFAGEVDEDTGEIFGEVDIDEEE